jgi:hypothetical protein
MLETSENRLKTSSDTPLAQRPERYPRYTAINPYANSIIEIHIDVKGRAN